ncbi:hypothetical protein BCT50_22190 [Vibrio lentus]|uniref:Uncharacterized protein n=2 Tax=Vibrio lentus TaxID=136468 RepID=A0A855ISD9_9VIBR|nr:hypothetical protein BCT50_22190 [Vibrio lentus]
MRITANPLALAHGCDLNLGFFPTKGGGFMKLEENVELLESAKGLAACGSEAATNWEQPHLVSLFIEIERKLERALRDLDKHPSI